MENLKEIATTTTLIELRSDGILVTKPNPAWEGTEELKHAQENMRAVEEISDGKLYPILSFLGDGYISEESRRYYSEHPPLGIASAMITRSFVQKMIGNFFMKFNKLKIPLKLFTDEDKAVAWLHSVKERASQQTETPVR